MLLENIQGRLKMEFPYYDCFPAITKLAVELHAIRESKSRANIVSYWKKDVWCFLFIVIPQARYQKNVC